MHEDMRALLNAYLDGELRGTRLMEMKVHLAGCEACRNELKELRLVSDLLQAAPDPEFIPAARFASNLALTLPRRNMHGLPPKPGSLAWWLVPAGILAAWYFFQTIFTLTGAFTAVQMTGLLGQAARWLSSGQETIWFAAVTGLFGSIQHIQNGVLFLVRPFVGSELGSLFQVLYDGHGIGLQQGAFLDWQLRHNVTLQEQEEFPQEGHEESNQNCEQ